MLKHFSTMKTAAAPAVNFNGVWRNELHSEMRLTLDAQGGVTGKYKTGVGTPGPVEECDLVGFASGDLLSFTVIFGAYGSLACWAGQHTVENGAEVIKTLWLMTRDVQDPDEPSNLWGATWTGANTFRR